eukprot:COSAG06_NODE_5715_length_3308_cov_2.093799_2_plen_179_part_00
MFFCTQLAASGATVALAVWLAGLWPDTSAPPHETLGAAAACVVMQAALLIGKPRRRLGQTLVRQPSLPSPPSRRSLPRRSKTLACDAGERLRCWLFAAATCSSAALTYAASGRRGPWCWSHRLCSMRSSCCRARTRRSRCGALPRFFSSAFWVCCTCCVGLLAFALAPLALPAGRRTS